MKKKSLKPFIFSQLLGIDQIALLHNQVMEHLRHKDHIELAFRDVNLVDVAFLQWFIALVRTAKSKPYSITIYGEIPSILIKAWELLGFLTPFNDFLSEHHVKQLEADS